MKIFEAYDKTKIRIRFKAYIEAEGVSLSKREEIYKRFGTYMSRIRSVLFDRLLLEAADEAQFRERLNHIFFDKWAGHLGYPEIPDYFFRYLDFLQSYCAWNDDAVIDGLADCDDAVCADGVLTRFEERFVGDDGKLRLLANPVLVRRLREGGLWRSPVSDEAVAMCEDFYAGAPLTMEPEDWRGLIANVLKPAKSTGGKRGDISFGIKERDGEVKIYNSTQAMIKIVDMAGYDKVAQCNLKLQGQPIVTRRVPRGREPSFKDMENGFFLNNMGTMMDRFKVMRVLISLYRLPLEITLSQEKSKKTPRKRKEPAAPPQVQATPAPEPVQPPQPSEPMPEGFVFGKGGTLNLFDEF